MALAFAIGAACFVVAPLGPYRALVGDAADGWTFFVGSLFFTTGGALQSLIGWGERSVDAAGRAAWNAAWIQSVGTVLFNVNTFRALDADLSGAAYDHLVWRPDAIGSICFLISGAILFLSSPRLGRWGLRPAEGPVGWWEPAVNLLGCILFGVSAVAAYAEPATGELIAARLSNWTTTLGALCFLACALATLRTGHTRKSAAHARTAAAA